MCTNHALKSEKKNMVGENVKCPFGVSTLQIMQVRDLHMLLCDLLMCAQTKVFHLENYELY